MMWLFKKNTRKTNEEIEIEQARAELARDKMDKMHKRLEVAVNGLLSPEKEERTK